jgi:hypothetical protein
MFASVAPPSPAALATFSHDTGERGGGLECMRLKNKLSSDSRPVGSVYGKDRGLLQACV